MGQMEYYLESEACMKERTTTGTDKCINAMLLICERISVVLLVILVICTLLQVFCRFVLRDALVWSEEISRFAGIWMVILSTSIAINTRAHMTIDLATSKFSERIQMVLQLISDVVILMVCVVMLYFGFVMAKKFVGTPAPATRISMGVIYAGVGVGWVCNVFVAAAKLWESMKQLTGREKR